MRNKFLSLCLLAAFSATTVSAQEDKYLWLEDVEGAKPMEWVKQQNAISAKEIKAYEGFDNLVNNSLAILNNKERIPYAERIGDHVYNFWKDEHHVRGIYRRTTMAEYKKISLNGKQCWILIS